MTRQQKLSKRVLEVLHTSYKHYTDGELTHEDKFACYTMDGPDDFVCVNIGRFTIPFLELWEVDIPNTVIPSIEVFAKRKWAYVELTKLEPHSKILIVTHPMDFPNIMMDLKAVGVEPLAFKPVGGDFLSDLKAAMLKCPGMMTFSLVMAGRRKTSDGIMSRKEVENYFNLPVFKSLWVNMPS